MKCSKCGHSRTWHLSSKECLYPASGCECKSFGSVVGFDLLALSFFTGTGVLIFITGALAILRVYLSGVIEDGEVFMGIVSMGLGLFLLTYMNIRSQRLARQRVLESSL
jgi:hypothetical protein